MLKNENDYYSCWKQQKMLYYAESVTIIEVFVSKVLVDVVCVWLLNVMIVNSQMKDENK